MENSQDRRAYNLAKSIELKHPDLEKSRRRLVETHSETTVSRYSPKRMIGLVGEAAINQALEEIANDHPEIVTFMPLREKAHTKNYILIPKRDSLIIMNSQNRKVLGEPDAVVEIDETIIAVESKLRIRYRPSNARGRSKGPRHAMKEEYYGLYIDALQEAFPEKNVKYALVIYANQINSGSSVQREFLEKGNLLIPFNTNGRSFSNTVRTKFFSE